MKLYTYLPKLNTALTLGILSTAKAPTGWEKYIARSGETTKEGVLRYLAGLDPDRLFAVSTFRTPISDDAPEEVKAFRDAKLLYLIDLDKLKKLRLLKSITTAAGKLPHIVKQPMTRNYDWKKFKRGKFLFSKVPHYLVAVLNGVIPVEAIRKMDKQAKKVNLDKFFFRSAAGKTPWTTGDFMFLQKGMPLKQLKDTLSIYLTPTLNFRARSALYLNMPLYAIERPPMDPNAVIASGTNSSYHFAVRDKLLGKRDIVAKFIKAIRTKDFSDPEVADYILKHKASKHYLRKGGKYLATLAEWDKLKDTSNWPEVMFKVKDLKDRFWLKLLWNKNKRVFIGLKTKDVYLPLTLKGLEEYF